MHSAPRTLIAILKVKVVGSSTLAVLMYDITRYYKNHNSRLGAAGTGENDM